MNGTLNEILPYVVGTSLLNLQPFGIYNRNIDINVLLKVLNVFKFFKIIFPLTYNIFSHMFIFSMLIAQLIAHLVSMFSFI